MFTHIMRQDIGWFDLEKNATGALTARLATEITNIKNITGQNLGRYIISNSSITAK